MRLRRQTRAAIVILAGLLGAPGSTAAAPAPAPAWSVEAINYPTNLVPGTTGSLTSEKKVPPLYQVVATNSGAAPTAGPYTITDVLPSALEPAPEPVGAYGTDGGELSCGLVAQTVTCTGTEPLRPGEIAIVRIPVKVPPSASEGVIVNQASVSGGGATPISASVEGDINSLPPPFGFLRGFSGWSTAATAEDGSASIQAGSHPYQLSVSLGFPSLMSGKGDQLGAAGGGVKDVRANLPPGVVINPGATARKCTEVQLESSTGCPEESQVGLAFPTVSLTTVGLAPLPLFNMVAAPGSPGELGFEVVEGVYVHLQGALRSDGDYGLSAVSDDILAKLAIEGVRTVLWGNPSDPSHDESRTKCLQEDFVGACPVARRDTALLTQPTACSGPLDWEVRASDWLEPSFFSERVTQGSDLAGNPVSVVSCDQLDFKPTISAKASTDRADSPSGLEFSLRQPQSESYDGLASASLRDATVILPQGMSLNPAAANGLDACTEAQVGYLPGAGAPRFSRQPQGCPSASKVGTLEVSTPLLDHSLPGAVFAAKPYENPFGSLLAIYLAIEDEATGTMAKLAGEVIPDPRTGQLTATFRENPQLPLEDIDLHLFKGGRAPLKTPLACGIHTTTSQLTPWSAPEGAGASPSDSFETSVAASGAGACPTTEAQAPNSPSFTAGTLTPAAGAFSPFALKITRPDGSQQLAAIDTTLPRGLAAKLAGVPYCSEAQIAAAKAREAPNKGVLEKASPSCPGASQVGTVTVGAGAGGSPLYVAGRAYLAGPYKGAPLSLVIITPAVAGPFDLGAVVVRTALFVNPETAQGRAVSDPLPTIREGIPLDVRSIAFSLDRPSFTLNPTSCDPMAVLGTTTSVPGQTAALSSRFQVGGCGALKFAPKLAMSLKGGTRRDKNPALKAVLTYPMGAYANISSAQVTLPHSEFLDQSHIGTVCTRVQFAADSCPPRSVYGFARAFSPLLDKPVEGPIYLRSSSHDLPDIVAALDGQIHVDLVGRVDTGKGGGIRATFEGVPDAPVSKAVVELKGGRKGLLVNSENICRKPQRAVANFTAQNGKVSHLKPRIANSCKGKGRAKKGSSKP